MFAFACGQNICFLTFVWRLRVYYFRYTLPSRDMFVYVRHIILVWDACSLYCYLFIVFLQCTVLESNWQHKRGEAYSGTTSIYMHPAIATTMNRVMPIYFLCTRRHEVWINVWMSNNFIVFLPRCIKCTYLSDVNTEYCHSLMSHDIYAISRSDKSLKL